MTLPAPLRTLLGIRLLTVALLLLCGCSAVREDAAGRDSAAAGCNFPSAAAL